MRFQKNPIVVLLPLLVVLSGAYMFVTAAESSVGDSDLDGVPDTLDIDDDNDGIPDRAELTAFGSDRDADADGMPDRLDLDSDNDGILDIEESGVFRRPEAAQIRIQGGRLRTAVGNNGFADLLENAPDSSVPKYEVLNSDAETGDTLPDYLDLDSDNDGLLDLVEAGVPVALDGNRDGRIDARTGEVGADGILDSLQLQNDTNCCDYDGDGSDDVTPRNTDGGDFPDFQDLDSDNDGSTDLLEAGGKDIDGDGRVDGFIDNPSNPDGMDDAFLLIPLTPADTNEDGIPDYLDPQTQLTPATTPASAPEPAAADNPPESGVATPGDTQQNLSPDKPAAMPLDDPSIALDDSAANAINTGLSGSGGCSIGGGYQDPLLPLMAFFALVMAYRQRSLRTHRLASACPQTAHSTDASLRDAGPT